MLKTLRSKTSGFVAKLILGLVVVAFVVTGFAGFFQGSTSDKVVAAGRTQLGADDYLLAWQQAEANLANRLQRRPTREEARRSGIESQVMSQLVTEAGLGEQARRLDLGLSEGRLAQLIADDPSFHDGAGNFSRANFRQLLSSIGMTENQFIQNRQQAAVRSQIVDAVARGANLPNAMKTAFGIYVGERRTADYVTLPVSKVEPVAEPAADAVTAYYDRYKQRYAAPELRSVSYALATPETLANAGAITDDHIRQDYEANRQRFTNPERRQVQQVLFKDKAAADAAKAELAGGNSFEDVVAGTGRSIADVDLGLRAKAQIADRAVADAAFALAAGQVSEVVQGTFGPVVLRVVSVEPEAVKPLDEVRDQIRRELAEQTGGEQLQQAQNAFDDARAGGAPFAEAAERAGLKVTQIPAVSRSGNGADDQPLADLPTTEGFLEAVFTAQPGGDNPPINIRPAGSLFYDVTKIDAPRERSLDEVRPRVIADWKSDEAQRLLGERATALKARLDGGETMDQIAAAEGLTKSVAAAVSRQTGGAQLGEGVDALFNAKEGGSSLATGPDGTSRILLQVTSIAPPIDPVASLGAGQARQLDQLMQDDLLQTYVDGLREAYQVVSYPQAIERAQASIR
ncbi:peptidyl-prolyl cis-trans isomerase [Aureimonas psammosilenae]|uniref:peptidyl-prolyl cis-trans isomerase n=1 Tax=Aureimonas psammosilenae TaxID=2495496 RepID=UPI001260FA05|nr:peptidyl-prolyl cis-trans isomerase [Aureimonas psammosilenae]